MQPTSTTQRVEHSRPGFTPPFAAYWLDGAFDEMFDRDGEVRPAYSALHRRGAYLFQGLTDATMSHGEGWQFIQVGRAIERAVATASLLDVYFIPRSADADEDSISFLEWAASLKSCTAFEAYVKIYGAQLEPANIAAFLLLNAEFPRSIRFATSSMKSGLHAIGQSAEGRSSGRPERLAGRLQADLDYGQIDEIMAGDLHAYLESIREQCEQVHRALHQTFIRYPIATALAARAG